MLLHGSDGTITWLPEFVPPRRSDWYELRSSPEVTRPRWHGAHPPGLRVISGRTSSENEIATAGSLSVLSHPVTACVPPSVPVIASIPTLPASVPTLRAGPTSGE